MRHLSILLVAAATLAGCVTEASGPRFTAQAPLIAGQARIYVLREKVFYLAQGPGIGKPEVAIDRRVIGHLENGGFLTADVPAGTHTVSVGTGEAETARGFIVAPGGEEFIDVLDKSRMAGARALGAGITGGALGGIAQAFQEQEEAAERHEGPIWRVDPIPPQDGMAILQTLSLSR